MTQKTDIEMSGYIAMNRSIDINCDLGEGKSLSDCQHDASLMPYISSCNIACGGHAGSPAIMAETLKNAVKQKLNVGAHPGYPDKENFGRQSVAISNEDLAITLKQQIDQLIELPSKQNITLAHIKFHGALYNDIETSDDLASFICQFCLLNYPSLKVMGLAGGKLEGFCKQSKVRFIAEGFMDRTYLSSGKLTPRSYENALISEPSKVVEQALSLINKMPITTSDHQKIKPIVDSICLHGDNKNALVIAKLLADRLTRTKHGFVTMKNKCEGNQG